MPAPRLSRATLSAVLDALMGVVGLAVSIPVIVLWWRDGGGVTAAGVLAVTVIVVMSRYPLVVTHRAGDVVIGFETCVLVYLVLTHSAVEAFALWAIGTTIASVTASKSWRSRVFNIGITTLSGGLLVLVVDLIDPGPAEKGLQLVAVMVACAAFFLFDLVVTAASLAFEDGSSLREVLRGASVLLGLGTFVAVDTLGYLAALLAEHQPAWTLLLLLVPVATILVAVRLLSNNRLAQLRLMGLLEAATHAPDWADEDQIERSLVVQAMRTLRHTTATMRDAPGAEPDISVPIEIEGRPTRHLVVSLTSSGRRFDEHDRVALEALSAVGASAFNRRRLSDEMLYLARHDALTGLHNRGVFTERLTEALAQRSPEGLLAVLYLDLDGFKEVNDVLGHKAGDRLLAAVADRIMGCLRESDMAARLGGDEFGVLLDDLTDPEQADAVAERLLTALAVPFETTGQLVRVRASVGIAFAADDDATAELLITSADTAMYAAKTRGKGRVARFQRSMREEELQRLELEAALREAVRADEVTVHYQPVVDLHTGAVTGFEALARWRDPVLGQVPPDRFIPAAERLGLIGVLGRSVLEQAYDGARALVAAGGRATMLGVNLSALQVTDADLAARVRELAVADEAIGLVLELTEGILLADDGETVAALRDLQAAGARIAIDDFGVGYSSVGYLHRLPVDILKIDKLFVAELPEPRSAALVQGVVAMARALGLTVVTEGVEDWGSARVLRDLGCDRAQGYLFGRPMPLDDAVRVARVGRIDLTPMSTVQPSLPGPRGGGAPAGEPPRGLRPRPVRLSAPSPVPPER